MRTRPVLRLATLLGALSAPSWAGPAGDCANGRCSVRRSLDAMSEAPPAALGNLYENSRTAAVIEASAVQSGGGSSSKRAATSTATSVRRRVPDVPAPKEAAEEKSGGIGGFLNRHKWQIGGALAGGLLTLALGGGIFGILIGIVASVAIAFIGPKIFSGKK